MIHTEKQGAKLVAERTVVKIADIQIRNTTQNTLTKAVPKKIYYSLDELAQSEKAFDRNGLTKARPRFR